MKKDNQLSLSTELDLLTIWINSSDQAHNWINQQWWVKRVFKAFTSRSKQFAHWCESSPTLENINLKDALITTENSISECKFRASSQMSRSSKMSQRSRQSSLSKKTNATFSHDISLSHNFFKYYINKNYVIVETFQFSIGLGNVKFFCIYPII